MDCVTGLVWVKKEETDQWGNGGVSPSVRLWKEDRDGQNIFNVLLYQKNANNQLHTVIPGFRVWDELL